MRIATVSAACIAAAGLLGCRGEWRNIRAFEPGRSKEILSKDLWKEDEAADRIYAELYLARRFGVLRDGRTAGDSFDEICPQDVEWDTLYRFAGHVSAPPFGGASRQDVEFPSGRVLRLVMGGSGNYAIPVYGDARDDLFGCDHCPDSTSLRTLESRCGS